MDYSALNKYEYKSPSYDLNDRSYPVNPEYQANSRFVYDEQEGIFRSKAGAKDEISLLFSGDLLCQENMLKRHRIKGGFDFSLCFEYIRPLLRSADFAAGNLETPVAHTAPYRGEIITHEGPYYCNAPLQYMEALAYAGFDMLYTANNHTLDTGARGLMETIENTRKFGMIQTGTFAEETEKFVVVDICGIRVGFTSFAVTAVPYNSMDLNLTEEGKNILLNNYSKENARALYKAMKARGAEYVVCFPHWGKEFSDTIVARQHNIAKTLTAIGYDLIAGSHAHVIQQADTVEGKPVLYSMGNLISHLSLTGNLKDISALTMLYSLKLKRQDGKIVPQVAAIPCRILRSLDGIPYSVVPVAEALPYSPEMKQALAGTAEGVAKRLGSGVLPIDTKYPVTAAELQAFEQARAAIPAKVAALRKARKPITDPAPAITDVVQDRGGVYILYEDHAELVRFVTPASTSTYAPPAVIREKPVTVYSNTSNGNIQTKLLYLPDSVETIGFGCFRNFTALESMRTVFASLKTIGGHAFENCTALTGLILPHTVETVEDHAFLGCSKLISVKIPASVTRIAPNAFEGCGKLTIYCEEGTYADAYAQAHQIPVKYMPLPKKDDAAAKASEAPVEEAKPAKKKPLEPFAGPAVVIPDAAEMDEIRKQLPAVKMGPMNRPEDPHPVTIIETCKILKHPLPADAVCGHQPSYYIQPKEFDGKRSTIVKLMGDKMPAMDSAALEKAYRFFRRKYQTQECLDRNAIDFTVYFCDYLLFARPRGFSHNDYFDFELYNKEPDVRDTFVDDEFRLHVYKVCAQKVYRDIFKYKPDFNTKFAEFVHRDWVDATTCSFEEFKAFASKHDRFFVKPLGNQGGKGAHIMETASDTMENLFQQCRSEGALAEEIIVQHDSLAAYNASTLNTVRVLTVLDANDEPHVLLGVARFGRSGNVVDNFHGGGVGAILDVDTGIVISEAINQAHIRKPIHPDSKLPIVGFQYPQWEQIKAAAKKAALVVPQVRNIGWDFAVTKNGDVEIVEGNSRSGFDVLQSPDQVGRKYLYGPYMADLARMRGIEPLIREPFDMETILNGSPKAEQAPAAPVQQEEPKPAANPAKSVASLLGKLIKR